MHGRMRRCAGIARLLGVGAAAGAAAGLAVACGSSTAPQNSTGRYVGTYASDTVIVTQAGAAQPIVLDSALGDTGTLTLKPDSFYATYRGLLPVRDSGTFTIDGSGKWTLAGSFFSGSGTGKLVGNRLQLDLTGGQAVGAIHAALTRE